MTPDLNLILDRLPTNSPPPYAEQIEDLSQFATIRRYEEGYSILTDEEVKAALLAARKILEWAER
jgi:hypothetical protein